MMGITKRTVTKSHPVQAWLVAMGMVLSSQAAVAVPAVLNVGVQSPALPATESDIITLLAGTTDDILPSGSWQTVTTNLEVNGFNIDWTLISNDTGLPGAAVPTPAFRVEDIGPLPAGTYNVTATWAMYDVVHIGVPPFLLGPPIEGPRVGTAQFTVVPEPATLALMSIAVMGVLGKRWKR